MSLACTLVLVGEGELALGRGRQEVLSDGMVGCWQAASLERWEGARGHDTQSAHCTNHILHTISISDTILH